MKRFLILLFIMTINLAAQSYPPKREVRAAWVATVVNLDWPSSRWAGTETQKNELITILNSLQQAGINTIVFQIRPECDALYESSYEPWSYWLTGLQGKAPSHFYDPLQFACEEASKRNMELHAWFNPYRAERSVGSFTLDPSHVTLQHPDWVLQIGNFKFLNPGLPEVREYVAKIVTDVVQRYDIDGVHFDDYFYPYPPDNITDEDSLTFKNYSRGFTDLGDWRRDNVNLLVEAVYDSINTWKPWVKFGISPFGIWKEDVPEGIAGTSSYSAIYCDPLAWLDGQYIDYVNPQIYWQIEGPQDYSKLMPWWGSVANGRHIYAGHALYKMGGSWNWPVTEITNQISLNRSEPNVQGSVFFRTDHIRYNEKGIADALETDLYAHPALLPTMPWKDSISPETPQVLAASIVEEGVALQWEAPAVSSDGDTAKWYVVYRFLQNESIDIENPQNIISVVKGTTVSYLDDTAELDEPYTYLVTSLDKLQNESLPSNYENITFTDIDLFVSTQPNQFILQQNYPNPFNPTTVISYQLSAFGEVDLSIYNLLGQKVTTLVSDKQPVGTYTVEWDATSFASGIYLYQLKTEDGFVQTRKLVLQK